MTTWQPTQARYELTGIMELMIKNYNFRGKKTKTNELLTSVNVEALKMNRGADRRLRTTNLTNFGHKMGTDDPIGKRLINYAGGKIL